MKQSDGIQQSIRITNTDILASILFVFIFINSYMHSSANDKPSNYYPVFSAASIYCLTRLYFNSRKHLHLFIATIAILNISEVIIGVFQVLNGHVIIGSFGGRATYANFLAATFPFALHLAIHTWRENKQLFVKLLFSFGATLTFLTIMLFTHSRTAFFTVFVTLILMVTREWNFESLTCKLFKMQLAKPFISGAITMCLVVLFMFKTDSTSGRWFIIKRQMNLLTSHPFTGIGFGNFDKAYNDQQALYFASHNDPKSEYLASHVTVNYNEYLDFVLKGGLLGLIVLILVLVGFFLMFTRQISGRSPFGYNIIAVLIIALFSYPSETMAIGCIFTLSIAILSSSDKQQLKISQSSQIPTFILVFALNVVLIIGMIGRYNSMVKWHIISTTQPKNQVALRTTIRRYDTIFPELNNDPIVLTDYARKLMMCGRYSSAIRILKSATLYSSKHSIYTSLGECYEAIGNYSEAKLSFIHASYLVPNLFYPRYRLMLVYAKLGQSSLTYKCAVKILHMPVKVTSPIVDEILQAALLKKTEFEIKHNL